MADKKPISAGLMARVGGAVSGAIGGMVSGWFGPGTPPMPIAPDEARGRLFDFPTAYNLRLQPRDGEANSFAIMRILADSYDLLRLVIETRKDQMARLVPEFQVIGEDGKAGAPDARTKELRKFFQYPDREHDWETWLRMLMEDLLVLDAPTLYPRKTLGGGMYALELIDGATIKRVIDQSGRTPLPPDTAYQQVLKGMPAVDYTLEELIYRPRNVRTSRVYGYSPVEQVIMTVNIALRRQVSQLQYYTEGNVPEALISVPKEWSAAQIKEYQQLWDALIEGNSASKRHAKFVPGDMKYQPTRETALKDEYDEWLARVVCFAFSISPQAFVQQMNRATAETAQEAALEEGLAPLMNWTVNTINYAIVNHFGYDDIKMTWANEKSIDPTVKANVHKIYVDAKVLTPDEVREDLGMEPLTPEQKDELSPPMPTMLPGDNPDGPPKAKDDAQPPSNKIDVHVAFPEIKLPDVNVTLPEIKLGDTIVDIGATTIKAEFPAADKRATVKTITAKRNDAGDLVGEIKETVDG